jgi:hypothetical protein
VRIDYDYEFEFGMGGYPTSRRSVRINHTHPASRGRQFGQLKSDAGVPRHQGADRCTTEVE